MTPSDLMPSPAQTSAKPAWVVDDHYIRTAADIWYEGELPQIRGLRGLDPSAQTSGIQAVIDHGLIPADLVPGYIQIFKNGFDPSFVFPVTSPRAADLIIQKLPFNPVFAYRKGDATGVGDFWIAPFGDRSGIGSYCVQAGKVFVKVVTSSSPNQSFYYADASLQWGDRALPGWLCVGVQ